jgi:hypothetical protein
VKHSASSGENEMKFRKVKFIQAVELAGRGYSPVGGLDRDGVYTDVPAEAVTDNWYFDALVSDFLAHELGDGDEASEEHAAAKDAAAKDAAAKKSQVKSSAKK